MKVNSFFLLISILILSCESSDSPPATDWTVQTHGKDAQPNYEVVFPQYKVNRIDLVIEQSDWQTMMDDMTEIYGPFGENKTPPSNPEPPKEAIEACTDKNSDSKCIVDLGAQKIEGTCQTMNNILVCVPENGSGGPSGGPSDMQEVPNPVWKPCTLKFENKNWNHVGVRFKGNSSLYYSWKEGNYKLPMRFTFDKFEDKYPEINNQRFYGFKKLALASNYRDDSLIREKVVSDIFRDSGVPASQTAFYRLYIDHGNGPVYFGLYTITEIPDDPMIANNFTKKEGNLYKPDGIGGTLSKYDEKSFDKQTNEKEADFSDIKGFLEVLHSDRTDAENWRKKLEKIFNVDGFLKWLAINNIIQNWDAYGVAPHNYYLYNDPGDGRFHWITWDHNESIKTEDKRLLPLNLSEDKVGQEWPLIRFLIDDSVYYKKYLAFVKETVENIFIPARMKTIYKKNHSLIRPYVIGNEGEIKNHTHLQKSENFDKEIEFLISHVESRNEQIKAFLEE